MLEVSWFSVGGLFFFVGGFLFLLEVSWFSVGGFLFLLGVSCFLLEVFRKKRNSKTLLMNLDFLSVETI